MRDVAERMRKHVNDRGGPTLNGAWSMMLEAAGEIENLRRALKPFADCVYNDNGDMTVSSVVQADPYIAAYWAIRR